MLFGGQDGNSGEQLGSVPAVHLTRADIALVIDALLQAEMTLPLIDPRHREIKAVEYLRARQLSLADQLEDLIANDQTA